MDNCKRISCILLIFTLLLSFSELQAAKSVVVFIPNPESVSSEIFQGDGLDVDIRPKKRTKKPKGARGLKAKKVTFETYEENYQKAVGLYNKQLYISAARLFEELYPLSLGTPRADSVLYLFADCYYQNSDFEMAAYHFKEYANKYSTNPRAEDAHFKAIQALSHLSPEYSLDQTETYYVIEEIEAFTRLYPNSSRMIELNALLDEMREKLALKDFEILKLYYNTENYKSAQIAARNFLAKYSYSKYADDAYAILVRNNYEYAQKSVESKKYERYTACVDSYNSMKINYPYSTLLLESEKYAVEAQAKIDKKNQKDIKKETKNKKKDKNHED